MDIDTVGSLSQLATRMGLLTEAQVQEVGDEMQSDRPHEFLRLCERKAYLTQWQSSKLMKGDTEGYFLGGFRLLYKIASGSFGRVFRADDPSSGRIVAVKVLRHRWSENQQRIDLFYREGHVGMTLKHPNIVEIIAVGQDGSSGQFYIVMEFVEGGNLREIQQVRKAGGEHESKFPLAEALKYIEDATSGLVYAYGRGVTHRDMKLTNVLISTDKTAKLVDFGLALVAAGGVEDRADKDKDRVDRTVDYAGLEKATGVKSGDVRSDIYFLGCVLYELITGKSPLEMSRDRNARMQKQRFVNVKPISRAEFHAPASVFSLVETMMALDPQQRYQTPAQLLEAIKNARRDVEGRATTGAVSQRSLYLVEQHEGLQDKMREKFKEWGYKVLVARDPSLAADRFRRQPYDAMIVDARTVGEDGVLVLQQILVEAEIKSIPFAGVVILGEDQASWQKQIKPRPNLAVLLEQNGQQVTLKEVRDHLKKMLQS